MKSSASIDKFSSARIPTSKSDDKTRWVSFLKWLTKKWMRASKRNIRQTSRIVSLCRIRWQFSVKFKKSND